MFDFNTSHTWCWCQFVFNFLNGNCTKWIHSYIALPVDIGRGDKVWHIEHKNITICQEKGALIFLETQTKICFFLIISLHIIIFENCLNILSLFLVLENLSTHASQSLFLRRTVEGDDLEDVNVMTKVATTALSVSQRSPIKHT